jgi:hypothetical protein
MRRQCIQGHSFREGNFFAVVDMHAFPATPETYPQSAATARQRLIKFLSSQREPLRSLGLMLTICQGFWSLLLLKQEDQWRWRRLVLRMHWHWFWLAHQELYGSTGSILTPPGRHLRSFAEFFFSRRTSELVLEPTLRDLLDEYCEALEQGRLWKARWVRVRGYWSFWSAAGAQLAVSFARTVLQIWKLLH